MEKVTPISSRKEDHIHINLEKDVASGLQTGLENYRFTHRALPEMNLDDVQLGLAVFNKQLNAPLFISSMTGGTKQAQDINKILAQAAQSTGIAMGVGSQRAAIDHPELAPTFQIRKYAPDILLFANLGAIQLNYGYGLEECIRAVEMIEADALILHLNALQEALQPEGDTRFAGLLDRIHLVCRQLQVPVVVKEVGWGFSKEDARRLSEVGVAAIDVAGAGGTSWSQVEMFRAKSEWQAQLAAEFINWGIPTVEAIRNVRQAAPDLMIIASGGLRSGIDILKCIALGAKMGGMAGPFLKAAKTGLDRTILTIENFKREMQVCLFAMGIPNLDGLVPDLLISDKVQ